MSSHAVSSILESTSSAALVSECREGRHQAGGSHSKAVWGCGTPGVKHSERTGLKCPSSVWSKLPVAMSKTATLPSMLPLARRRPSGLCATLSTKLSFLKASSACTASNCAPWNPVHSFLCDRGAAARKAGLPGWRGQQAAHRGQSQAGVLCAAVHVVELDLIGAATCSRAPAQAST